jgi:hypothetical protein
MKTLLITLLLAVSLASGCASHGPVGSFCGPLPEQSATKAIADDAVSILAGLYPPGHTSLRLLAAEKADNTFAAALENGLRAKGFTLADSPDAVGVAYTLDALEEKTVWYLQLRLSDGKTIARAYTAKGQPEAGQSRATLDSVRSNLGKLADKAKEQAGRAYDSARELLE